MRKRDGDRCGNPGCGNRKGLQAHHIQYRASGGRTVMMNEVALCRSCHTLVHAGLLQIERGPEGELRFEPRARAAGIERSLGGFPNMTDLMDGVTLPSTHVAAHAGAHVVDGHVEALVGGLVSLGFNQWVARQRLDAAIEQLRGSDSPLDESVILREGLRMGPRTAPVG